MSDSDNFLHIMKHFMFKVCVNFGRDKLQEECSWIVQNGKGLCSGKRAWLLCLFRNVETNLAIFVSKYLIMEVKEKILHDSSDKNIR